MVFPECSCLFSENEWGWLALQFTWERVSWTSGPLARGPATFELRSGLLTKQQPHLAPGRCLSPGPWPGRVGGTLQSGGGRGGAGDIWAVSSGVHQKTCPSWWGGGHGRIEGRGEKGSGAAGHLLLCGRGAPKRGGPQGRAGLPVPGVGAEGLRTAGLPWVSLSLLWAPPRSRAVAAPEAAQRQRELLHQAACSAGPSRPLGSSSLGFYITTFSLCRL